MIGKSSMRTFTLACAAMAAGMVSVGACGTGFAQGPPPPGVYERHDPQAWNAPRGYDEYYHENGQANLAARQGYSAGFAQGESDFRRHHSYRPTHVDTYKHVPDSPDAINRNDFKHLYRQAFERGYAKGFGR